MVARNRIAELSLYVVLVAPLVVSSSFLFGDVLPRWVWLLGTIFIFGLVVLFGTQRKNETEKWRMRWIDVSLSALILIMWFSLFFASDLIEGLWSTAGRTTGTMLFLILFLLYACVRRVAWSRDAWRRILSAVVYIAAIASAWACVEYVFGRFGGANIGFRVGGPAGNPLILGGYLAPILFIATYLFFENSNDERVKKQRYFIAASFALIACAVFLTFTRSAYLGVIVGAIFSCGVFIKQQNIRMIKIIFCCAFICVTSYAALNFYAQSHALPAIPRILINNDSLFTLKTRFLNWNVAIEAIKQRPSFGWGWGNYRSAVDKNFDSRLAQYSFYETRIDKPHNVFLEMWATTGTVGFAIYLGFLASIFYAIRRVQASGAVSARGAWVIGGFFVATSIQNFFTFDTPQSLLVFFVVCAFVATHDPHIVFEFSEIKFLQRRLLAGIFLILMIPILIYGGLGVARAGFYIQAGQDAAMAHDIDAVDRLYRSAMSGVRGPYYFETWRWFAQAFLYDYAAGTRKISEMNPDQLRHWNQDVDQIAASLTEYTAQHPTSVDWQTFGGKIAYYIAIARGEDRYLGSAERLFLRSYELSPRRQEAPVLLGYVYGLKGNTPAAIQWYEIAATLSGTDENKRLLNFLLGGFIKTGDAASSVKILEIAVRYQPDAETFAQLAAAYAAQHRYSEAQTAVARAVELDASFAPDAQKFLSTFPSHK